MRNLKIVAAVLMAVVALSGVAAIAQEMVEVEHRSAEVLKRVGRTVVIRTDTGEIKKYSKIPEGVKIYIGDKQVGLMDLQEGMRLSSVRFVNVTPPSTITMEEVEQMPAAEVPAAKPAPMAKPAPKPMAAPAQLPKTGSHLPLAGQAGLALLLIGGGLALIRRF